MQQLCSYRESCSCSDGDARPEQVLPAAKLACSTLRRYASICSSCPSRSLFFLRASRARSLLLAAMSSLAIANSFAMRSSTCAQKPLAHFLSIENLMVGSFRSMANAFSVRPLTCSHESLAEKSGIMTSAGAERALLTGGTCIGMTILGKAIVCEGPTARAVQSEAHPFPLSCELPALCLQLQDSPVCVCDFAPAGMGTFFISTDCQSGMKRRHWMHHSH